MSVASEAFELDDVLRDGHSDLVLAGEKHGGDTTRIGFVSLGFAKGLSLAKQIDKQRVKLHERKATAMQETFQIAAVMPGGFKATRTEQGSGSNSAIA